MITQREAYEMIKQLKEEGKSNMQIARALAKAGWVSRVTGRRLSEAGVSKAYSRMNDPKYRISNRHNRKASFDSRKANRYEVIETVAGKMAVPYIAKKSGIGAIQDYKPSRHYEGSLQVIEDLSKKHRLIADALDILIAAVK